MLMALAQDDLAVHNVIYDALESNPNKKSGKKLKDEIGLNEIEVITTQKELLIGLSKTPTQEILLLNWFLPGDLHPEELVETILQLAPNIQIIVVVGYLDDDARRFINSIWRFGVKLSISWETEEIDTRNLIDMVIDGLKKAVGTLQAARSETVPAMTNNKPTKQEIDISKEVDKNNAALNKSIPASSRTKPKMIMGIGDTRIEEWIRTNFLDVEVMASSVDPEELKKTIKEISPDICIFMRQSLKGGVPEADDLVVWAADYVPAILFLVGELDDEGKEMAIRAREAGVRNIITCEIGGEIYGDEFVFVLKNIIREVQGGRPGQGKNRPPVKGLTKSLFLRGAGILGKAVKQTAETASEKVKSSAVKKSIKPKINKNEGISLDEEPEQTVAFQNLNNPTAIVPGGILAVVSPWRPGLAGRLAAQAVKIFSQGKGVEVAYIGASGSSTGALWLDLPEDVLMMSDWRVPGSNYPIALENLRIYAVDPVKNLSPEIQGELWNLLKDARKTATYTVMDFAGDIANAQKAAHQGRSVLLVILPGNDPVELKISSHWMKNIMDGKQNVVTGIDLRGVPHSIPEGMKPKIIVRNNPADALTIALSKNINEEFIWN
ncbi:MAG: hypothetical protein VR68_08630 [Peptococcaceae bacterium BRH_c4a]|nr:MAG: hypothetical protein VR68_08630 [Peptococcaceae bacterium BRH_c4a]